MSAGTLETGTPTGRAVIAAATLGSGMALLDGTVVNVALRTIGEDLGASLAQLQWITNGYLLALASLILVGGSLGDRYGRRRVFELGVAGFAAASLACALAPTPGVLIAARVVQGVAAALLTPGSLALIQGAFRPEDRGVAIGAWSGLGSIAAAIGPLVGGLLVEHASWRWIFALNLPLAALTLLISHRSVPESRDPEAGRRLDPLGALLATGSLAGITYALIEWRTPAGPWAGLAGLLAGVGFVLLERRTRTPMLPMGLFADRVFSAANTMTLLVYAALGAVLFFLVLQLQTVTGYGALAAGLATLPITVCMVLLAARGGALGQRIGPRIPMALGPLVMAAGVLWLTAVRDGSSYWLTAGPALTVFGLGLALMVAPLTATVLAAAPDRHAGVASGVNNAVARAGSLLAVSALPLVVGLAGDDYADPAVFDSAYDAAMLTCAALLAVGGLVSWLLIPPGRLTDASIRR